MDDSENFHPGRIGAIENHILFESWYRPGTDVEERWLVKSTERPDLRQRLKTVESGLGSVQKTKSRVNVVASYVARLLIEIALRARADEETELHDFFSAARWRT